MTTNTANPDLWTRHIVENINGKMPESYREELRVESIRECQLRGSDAGPRRVAIVGGAGYIGTIVTRHLLDCGYALKCIDNMIYGQFFTPLPFLTHPNYEFLPVDLCDSKRLNDALADCSDVVILAGLVGDPITKKYPEESDNINSRGLADLVRSLNSTELNKVVFVSTCSNYGLIAENEIADEDHELKPLSLYAKAKVEIEELLLNSVDSVDYNPTILRFSTAFGYSPRMRFDLTVNEFARDLYLGKELLVYDADTWRPYCHVEDFAETIRRVLEAPFARVRGKVFNAGSDSNNFTKRQIVEHVLEFLPNGKVSYQEKGSDPRNYRVNFQRLRDALLFEPGRSIDYGIAEILRVLELGFFDDIEVQGNSWFGNYTLAK